MTADEQYGAVKAVCEGKELPSIGATEEFSETVLGQLDMVLEAATGGKGKINAMSELEQAAEKLSAELRDKLDEYQGLPEERREKAEKEVVKLANRLESKLEQSEMYGKLIEENMARRKSQIKAVISASVEKARMRGEEVKAIISAWGDGDGEMWRTPLNTEILRRVSASYKLKYIAKFLGRFKEMLTAKRTSGFTYGRGEIYDVSRGSGLHGALTSELSYLARPELMPLFFKKMQRGQIKQYHRQWGVDPRDGLKRRNFPHATSKMLGINKLFLRFFPCLKKISLALNSFGPCGRIFFRRQGKGSSEY